MVGWNVTPRAVKNGILSFLAVILAHCHVSWGATAVDFDFRGPKNSSAEESVSCKEPRSVLAVCRSICEPVAPAWVWIGFCVPKVVRSNGLYFDVLNHGKAEDA